MCLRVSVCLCAKARSSACDCVLGCETTDCCQESKLKKPSKTLVMKSFKNKYWLKCLVDNRSECRPETVKDVLK